MKNLILNTDSYKASHWLQYPPNTQKVFSYIESRGGKYQKHLFFGLQAYIKEYLTKPITKSMIDEAEEIFKWHGEPFNRKGWERIIEKYQGYLPLKIRSVKEGTVLPTKNVLVSVENTDPEFFWLTSYVETSMLRAVWYGTTVASNSWSIKQVIKKALEKSGNVEGLPFKLHDFGARGVSSLESAEIGGAAHLVNFMGTDTISGIMHAKKYYNAGTNFAFSIPAAEHSTMTTWGGKNGEVVAMRNMLQKFAKPNSLVAVVSDSYDIYNAVSNLWGRKLKQEVLNSGATVVVRPDSGHPATVVLKVVQLLEEAFGSKVNDKGYKVLHPAVRVIQGDGINEDSIIEILDSLMKAGYSADNIAFGMGGALLQQVDRDTLKFAMKASAAFINNKWTDVYKDPITDKGKVSKRGKISLYRNEFGHIETRPEGMSDGHWSDIMEDVFENGKLLRDQSFEEIRELANKY